MYEAKLLYQLWDYAIEHGVWLKNRLPTAALPFGSEDHFVATAITPYMAYTGVLPDFSKLKVFGCKAYPRKSEAQYFKKFEPRIKAGGWIFIGMQGSTIWKVLNIETLAEARTTDCGFNEYDFPEVNVSPRLQETVRKTAMLLPPLLEGRQVGDRVRDAEAAPERGSEESARADDPDLDSDTIIVDCPEVGTSDCPVRDKSSYPVRDKQDYSKRESKAEEPAPEITLGRPTKELNPIEQRLSYGRLIKKKVFGDSIAKIVKAIAVVHLSQGESSVTSVPQVPTELVLVEQAIKEDALE